MMGCLRLLGLGSTRGGSVDFTLEFGFNHRAEGNRVCNCTSVLNSCHDSRLIVRFKHIKKTRHSRYLLSVCISIIEALIMYFMYWLHRHSRRFINTSMIHNMVPMLPCVVYQCPVSSAVQQLTHAPCVYLYPPVSATTTAPDSMLKTSQKALPCLKEKPSNCSRSRLSAYWWEALNVPL